MAYTCICDKVGDFQFEIDDNNELISSGKFTVSFGVASNPCMSGDRSNEVKWDDRKKNKIQMDVNDNFKAVIAKSMTENGHDGGFMIHGYTKCKLRHKNDQIV